MRLVLAVVMYAKALVVPTVINPALIYVMRVVAVHVADAPIHVLEHVAMIVLCSALKHVRLHVKKDAMKFAKKIALQNVVHVIKHVRAHVKGVQENAYLPVLIHASRHVMVHAVKAALVHVLRTVLVDAEVVHVLDHVLLDVVQAVVHRVIVAVQDAQVDAETTVTHIVKGAQDAIPIVPRDAYLVLVHALQNVRERVRYPQQAKLLINKLVPLIINIKRRLAIGVK